MVLRSLYLSNLRLFWWFLTNDLKWRLDKSGIPLNEIVSKRLIQSFCLGLAPSTIRFLDFFRYFVSSSRKLRSPSYLFNQILSFQSDPIFLIRSDISPHFSVRQDPIPFLSLISENYFEIWEVLWDLRFLRSTLSEKYFEISEVLWDLRSSCRSEHYF